MLEKEASDWMTAEAHILLGSLRLVLRCNEILLSTLSSIVINSRQAFLDEHCRYILAIQKHLSNEASTLVVRLDHDLDISLHQLARCESSGLSTERL